jgi:hypothetical protein
LNRRRWVHGSRLAPVALCLVALLAVSMEGCGSSAVPRLAPPKLGQSFDIGLVSGTVIVKPPTTAAFRLGSQDRNIPVGSALDTRHGEVDLRAAPALPNRAATLQDGQFSAGLFSVFQRAGQHGQTELDLTSARNRSRACAAGRAPSSTRVSARVLALLSATAHGDFQTRGRYSAATVRGTAWDTIDRCDGTLIRAIQGVVIVRDFRLHKTITLEVGQQYLAKAH